MTLVVGPGDLVQRGVPQEQAEALAEEIMAVLQTQQSPAQLWENLKGQVLLSRELPFAVHHHLFSILSRTQHPLPLPAWQPDEEDVAHANLSHFAAAQGLQGLEQLHRWSVEQREDFWQTVIDRLGIVFRRRPRRIADLSDVTAPRWCPGGRLNIAESCFQADPDASAIVTCDGPDQPIYTMTYGQLNRASNRVANSLRAAGFKPGDGLAVDMIMNAVSVVIYLGIIKAGCKVISIADSFSPEEIATRLRIGKAVGIFTMDQIPRGGKRLPLYTKVVAARAPKAIVLPAGGDLDCTLRNGDLAWDDFLVDEDGGAATEHDPHDHINILFSSGTTGDPKAITWNHTTPLKAAMDAHFHHDVHPGDVLAWPTNLGWMMGPWLIFAALLNRATIALYPDAPLSRDFCTFVQDAKVTMLGVVPSLVKAWRNQGAAEGLDWSAIRAFSSTGECSNAEDMLYLMSLANYRPVVEYCGGTEIGGGYLCGSLVKPASPSTFTTPSLGLEFFLLDEDGKPAEEGEIFIVPPSIGLSVELLNQDHYQVYFEGVPKGPGGEVLRRHGDQIRQLPGGFFRAQGRADDTMNLGGIKISSAEIERVLKPITWLDESAAIAVEPEGGGPSFLVIYVVAGKSVPSKEQAREALQLAIRQHLNPLFKIHDLVFVDALPRTASNKVMRRVLRRQYQAS